MSSTMEPKKKRGRPRKKPEASIIADQPVTICPHCGSSEREGYYATQTIQGPVGIGGVIYARVELKRTRCKACNRPRIDRFKIPKCE